MIFNLPKKVFDASKIPVIASDGMRTFDHFRDVIDAGHAVAIAHVFHYDQMIIDELRAKARDAGINVRPPQ